MHLHREAATPFVPLGNLLVPIIQDYTIDLSTTDGNMINYHIVGNTKDYPAYEIYIGCRLMTGIGTPYMPPAGTTVKSLLLPATHAVDVSGQISEADASSCDPQQSIGISSIDSLLVDPHMKGGEAVPEPSTWALMLLGFAGLGYAAFRRLPARLRRQLADESCWGNRPDAAIGIELPGPGT